MTDSYREQRPLLCDHCSDEEFDVKSYNNQRRNRLSVRSGRARSYVKGAATVITRWPDNCSTSVAYWWGGVSMIAIIVFVIYNSVLIFGMIPKSEMTQPKYRVFNNEIRPKELSLPDVYMHLIIHNSTDVFLNKYLPYVRSVSKKYPSFKYRFLIIQNDTLKDYRDYNDEERNKIALNTLWADERMSNKISRKYNISVEYMSLTEYLNNSPIKKFWRHLPPHLIEFLMRSISIWEKGGIAFNPKILIPKLSNHGYTEKLYNILNNYKNSNRIFNEQRTKTHKRRPNNIRDIINYLQKDENNNLSNIDLSEAESIVNIVSNTENILKFNQDSKYNSEMNKNNMSNFKVNKSYPSNLNLNHLNQFNISSLTNRTQGAENVIPLFLKYLFDSTPERDATTSEVVDIIKNNSSSFNDVIHLNQNQSLPEENVLKTSVKRDDYNGSNTRSESENLSMPYKQMPIDTAPILKINKSETKPDLSVDIKGNIIATKTACHAFLGTMFSNVIQYAHEETLTDFIISELSLFCNGLLSSCTGIDVILV